MATLSRLAQVRTLGSVSAVLFTVAALSGCGDSYPADMTYGVRTDALVIDPLPTDQPKSFGGPGQWTYLLPAFKEGGGTTLDPNKLGSEHRRQLDKTLTELFGTPAAPKVAQIEGISEQTLMDLKLVKEENKDPLVEGSRHYRRHCLHCHGLTGDGHGPTAAWVNPHPRDYRPGRFKFTSSSQSLGTRKPRREDLIRVLKQGVEGTSMPSFGLLSEDELQSLASYVVHLSLRGQCEFDLINQALAGGGQIPASEIDQLVKGYLVELVGSWAEANKSLIEPAGQPKVLPATFRGEGELSELHASISRGHKLFLGAQPGSTSCISCHMNYGRTPNLKYDNWGTVVRPADLTTGVYRGGRRPIDLFWRIHSGINGVGMPPFPASGDAAKDNAAMWDLINFMLALPYPKMLPKDVHDAIYPPAEPAQPLTTSLE